MGKMLLHGFLAACVVWAGCASDENGTGGAGGSTGPTTAVAFDAQKALEVGPTAAGSVAVGVRLGTIVANVLSTLASGLLAATPNLTRKVLVPGFCSTGTADVTVQPPLEGMLEAGDVVTLTLQNCAGSPVSEEAANGTIVLEMLEVSGGLPVIGGILRATATLNLTIAPDTTIMGEFEVNANIPPSLVLANLTFGTRAPSDLITVSEGPFQAQFACFDIFQRVGLAGPGIEFFRPLGVLKQGTEVFTMNSYSEGAPNIGFMFAGFDATPQSGSLTLVSGDRSDGACGVLGTPTPNESFVTATFTGGGCVSLDGTDTQGTPFREVTTWDDWLEAEQPGSPNECEGTGGTGGSVNARIVGQVLDTDDVTGLPGVSVRAVKDMVGTLTVETNQSGFDIPVSEVGDYELCAVGVIEDQWRFVSTNCAAPPEADEVATVTPATETVTVDLSIKSGYHLDVLINAPFSVSQSASPVDVVFDYQAWNRSGAPGAVTWIVIGLEGVAQDTHSVADGMEDEDYQNAPPIEQATLQITPAAAGQRIFVRQVATSTAMEAMDVYESSFPTARTRNYVEIGTVQ